MANQYSITVNSQPSLYAPCPRNLDIYFSEPETGINNDTGILLLSSGYGGQANSNVFHKMREQFADKYNYVVVQCNYFGWEYMQDIELTPDQLKGVPLGEVTDSPIPVELALGETEAYMNDMGPVQALDQLIAMKVVVDILRDNNYHINPRRIHAYGFSHGAYINYLCNAFMPDVFTGLIDNSSYLLPTYIEYGRTLEQYLDSGHTIKQVYIYLLHNIIDDYEIYKLPLLYSRFHNRAKIISFNGVLDHMTKIEDKCSFLNSIPNAVYEIITEDTVDGEIFQSAKHGLRADFIKMFDYVMNKYDLTGNDTGLHFTERDIQTENYIYHITMKNDIPCLQREKIIS
ncbi:MAG: DUF2920 family protein [Lachnospiraceae bacterium]|nr:DUF2920 family protein [Lachnospiraceae bacterium]